MKQVHFFQNTPSLFALFFALLFLSSCTLEHEVFKESTVEASWEDAKFLEKGTSALKYYPKSGVNIVAGDEWYIMGIPWDELLLDDVPVNSYSETYDTIPRVITPANKGSLGIKVGLGYVGKGAKFGDFSLSMNDIEVPVTLMYHYPLGPGSIHGGLGPFFAYGVGGSFGNGESLYGANNGGFRHFDAGVNFRAGYILNNGLYLDLGYDLGLANIEYATQDVKGYSRSFSVNIGYQIGRLFSKKK